MVAELTYDRGPVGADRRSADPLAGIDWDRLRAEWGDRRDLEFRNILRARGLGPALEGLSAVSYRLQVAPALPPPGEPPGEARSDGFIEQVRTALDDLYRPLPGRDPIDYAADCALVTAFAHLEALIAWENCAYYGRILAYVDELATRAKGVLLRQWSAPEVAAVADLIPEHEALDIPAPEGGNTQEALALRALDRVVDGSLHPELLAAALPGQAGDYQLLVVAAVQTARGLDPQLRTENALFCSCPVDMERRSAQLAGRLAPASATLDVLAERVGPEEERPPAIPTEADPDASVMALAELLGEDTEVALSYFRLLTDHVAPAGGRFVDALWDRDQVPDADRALEEAIRHLEVAEGIRPGSRALPSEESESLEGDVFASEAKAHRIGLGRMREALGQPALLLEEGEIAYLYPFAFPEVDATELVDALLPAATGSVVSARADRQGPALPHLFGFEVDIDPTPTSDAWSNPSRPDAMPEASALGGGASEHWDRLHNRGLTIRLRHHRLYVDTTEPRRTELNLEIRINSFGYHFVRVSVAPESLTCASTEFADQEPGADGEPARHFPPASHVRDEGEEEPGNPTWGPSSGWTGHEIDQWVRRVSHDAPEERWQLIRPRRGPDIPTTTDDGGRHPTLDTRYRPFTDVDHEADPRRTGFLERTRVIDVVRMLVSELHHAVVQATGSTGAADYNDLHTGAHVIITVIRLSAIEGDPRVGDAGPSTVCRRVEDPRTLHLLVGASTLLLPQRPEPTSLEQWVRHQVGEPSNLLTGIGLPGDLIHRNLDVTLLCPQESPAWAITPWLEMCENSAALAGLYNAWSVWARVRAMDENVALQSDGQDDGHDRKALLARSKALAAEIGRVRAMLDHLHSLQLTRSVQQSRLFHSLLEAGGLDEAERGLREAVDALERQHDAVVAQTERAWQHQAERRELAFEIVLAFLAVTGITGLFGWINAEFPGVDRRWPLWDVAAFVVVLAAAAPLIARATGLTRYRPRRAGVESPEAAASDETHERRGRDPRPDRPRR